MVGRVRGVHHEAQRSAGRVCLRHTARLKSHRLGTLGPPGKEGRGSTQASALFSSAKGALFQVRLPSVGVTLPNQKTAISELRTAASN